MAKKYSLYISPKIGTIYQRLRHSIDRNQFEAQLRTILLPVYAYECWYILLVQLFVIHLSDCSNDNNSIINYYDDDGDYYYIIIIRTIVIAVWAWQGPKSCCECSKHHVCEMLDNCCVFVSFHFNIFWILGIASVYSIGLVIASWVIDQSSDSGGSHHTRM